MNTIRVGAEVKVTPQFAVRAGVAYSDSPIKDKLKNGEKEVFTVGTIPNYTIDKGVMNYTVGIGYRFTPNFYTDLACVFRTIRKMFMRSLICLREMIRSHSSKPNPPR